MHRYLHVLSLVFATALIGAVVIAADSDTDKSAAAAKGEESQRSHGHGHDLEPLGKTVKLIFRIKEGDDDNKMSVYTATTRFSLDVTYAGEEGSDYVGVFGRVKLLDDRGKKLLVAATWQQRHDGAAETFDTSSECSAIVTIGEEANLLETDAYALTVEVEEVKGGY